MTFRGIIGRLGTDNKESKLGSVLLVEDSVDIQLLLQSLVPECDWHFCTMLSEAEELLHTKKFLLAIFDIRLPDGDGLEFYSKLRKKVASHQLPAIFISADNSLGRRVRTFELGAEDFISKPFDFTEARARILGRVSNLLRTRANPGTGATQVSEIIVGDVSINFKSRKVTSLAASVPEELELTATEFRMLHFFATAAEKVFSRQAILERVWGRVNVSPRTVDSHVSRLRSKLQGTSIKIDPVSSIGYSVAVKSDSKNGPD